LLQVPPKEVLIIRTDNCFENNEPLTIQHRHRHLDISSSDTKLLAILNGNNENEGQQKQKKNIDVEAFAIQLVRNLEWLRTEHERYEVKYLRLESEQDTHMVSRKKLIKACVCTCPFFVYCGMLDAFVSTVVLVWVLVELDLYMDLVNGDAESQNIIDCDLLSIDSDRNCNADNDNDGMSESF